MSEINIIYAITPLILFSSAIIIIPLAVSSLHFYLAWNDTKIRRALGIVKKFSSKFFKLCFSCKVEISTEKKTLKLLIIYILSFVLCIFFKASLFMMYVIPQMYHISFYKLKQFCGCHYQAASNCIIIEGSKV